MVVVVFVLVLIVDYLKDYLHNMILALVNDQYLSKDLMIHYYAAAVVVVVVVVVVVIVVIVVVVNVVLIVLVFVHIQ
jgi:hypothetical protein